MSELPKRLSDEITFGAGLELLLVRFDELTAKLRDIHEDESFLNDEAKDYKNAMHELVLCQRDIFALKNMSITVQALKDAGEE